MSPGILGINNVTMKNLTDVINITTGDPTELLINVNHIVYNGWYWFIILGVVWVILYFAAQEIKDQSLVNFMYAGAVCTIISFLMRAIFVIKGGVVWGMLTDSQMWVFPLVTIIAAAIVYNSKSVYG